jgi:hypothetical protein
MDHNRRMLGLVICLLLSTAVSIRAQPQYTVTDLGTCPSRKFEAVGSVLISTLAGGPYGLCTPN